MVNGQVPPEERQQLTTLLAAQQPFRCCPVYLDEETADGYYNGFSNNVLWPLLHYIPLSMLDSHGDAAERQWSCYQAANAAFCDAVMSISPTELDTVWVQDYHLMLLPQYLRDASPSLSIGWFLHTPFVIADMYLTLPHREEILRGVLGAGLCGAAHRPTSPCDGEASRMNCRRRLVRLPHLRVRAALHVGLRAGARHRSPTPTVPEPTTRRLLGPRGGGVGQRGRRGGGLQAEDEDLDPQHARARRRRAHRPRPASARPRAPPLHLGHAQRSRGGGGAAAADAVPRRRRVPSP